MIESNFHSLEAVKPLYDEIVPAYQSAFAGEPWYEVSKCADKFQRCLGGLSALAVGQSCELCNASPSRSAYEPAELIERFERLAASRPTAWYTERAEDGLTLAAIAWQSPALTIAEEKYADVPEMAEWMSEQVGKEPIVWLDEVFANRALKISGNLRNFGAMNRGFMERLGSNTLAFRTINERMVAATKRDFASQSSVFEGRVMVPDRREFVVIKAN
jgi:hypothetical protein